MNASPHLLDAPHHDGSTRYVSQPYPRVGESVDLLVRVPLTAAVAGVHVRTTPDAEPQFTAAHVIETTAWETWWQATIRIVNPVTSYRFLLEGGACAYQWLNGTGVHDRDVPDAADFRLTTFPAPPAWARDAIVYQVFPDRFARSVSGDVAADGGVPSREVPAWAIPATWDTPVATSGKAVAAQLYGGDLDGITAHLDHIRTLGADVLYLTPFFPAASNHRYDASTFDEVDPVLGGDAALDRLVDAAHGLGMRVLGDLTTNHTGVGHEWFTTARADRDSPERGFYFFDGEEYDAWLNVPSLPKLNYDSPVLWQRLFADPGAVVRRFLSGPHALDGWRVDVANMTGRHGVQDHNARVAREMRRAVDEARSNDGFLLAEHCHDFAADTLGDGWHGVMNYVGFTRPVWTWLRDPRQAPAFLGSPLRVPRLPGGAVMATMREFAAITPWRTLRHSFNLVGSHDTTRVRTLVGDDLGQVEVAAGLLFTMPGIPMVTYGDEIGMAGEFGEDGRRPMPWGGGPDAWNVDLLETYRALIAVRKNAIALSEGGLRWVHASEDALVFLREHVDQVALIHVARHAHDPIRLPRRALGGCEGAQAAYGPGFVVDGEHLVLAATGPTVRILTWQPNP